MRTRIPRYIDDPPQVFWWEADEVAAFSGAFVLGGLSAEGLSRDSPPGSRSGGCSRG